MTHCHPFCSTPPSHPYVPPLCPTPMSHFLPGICWYAILQVVYPESLPLCNPPFHPTPKGYADQKSTDRLQSCKSPINPANPASDNIRPFTRRKKDPLNRHQPIACYPENPQ